MKTPYEIKRGLKCCHVTECSECPYMTEKIECREIFADALAYIQQLEANYQQVSKALCGKENATLDEVLQAIKQVECRLAQAEQDAVEMAHDLDCSACKWCEYKDFDITNEACKECRMYNEGFKLRGVCPENMEG